MADQTYNLTQTGEEVQAIINDANGVKGAGSTTSLTTDYIMLKDTSGAYHKIQKSSFTEAVRNTLASLLVNNDKGTTISQIAAIASGDFGSVTPANLASVLGAQGNINATMDSIDANDFEIGKLYAISDTTPNQELHHPGKCLVLTWKFISNQFRMQLGIGPNHIYTRSCWEGTWSSWV